jgi:hypothetical protein
MAQGRLREEIGRSPIPLTVARTHDGTIGRPLLKEALPMTTNQLATHAPAPTVTGEAKNWAVLSHLSAFVMFFGVPALVGPLLFWLLKRDLPYVDDQAKEALNFNISFLIYGIVAGFLVIFLIGLLLLPIVFVTWFVLVIVAAVRAAAGEHYRYPLTLRLVN